MVRFSRGRTGVSFRVLLGKLHPRFRKRRILLSLSQPAGLWPATVHAGRDAAARLHHYHHQLRRQ